MRAAEITERGGVPRQVERADPDPPGGGGVLLALRAATVNPVDLAIAAGRFYRPVPEPPYVPGVEAVAEVVAGGSLPPGSRVWCLTMHGCMAERFVVDEKLLHPVPEGISDELAVGLGVAGLAGWMPVVVRGALAAGERVLVLGANGSAGRVALWAARARSAARVVAVAREGSTRGLAAAADAVVALEGDDLPGRLLEALEGRADLVVDPVWGAPAAAAIQVMAPRGRLVQVGNAAGPIAELPAGPIRGGRLEIRGFSVFMERESDLSVAYAELCAAAIERGMELPIERYPLERVEEAWLRQVRGDGRVKVVVSP